MRIKYVPSPVSDSLDLLTLNVSWNLGAAASAWAASAGDDLALFAVDEHVAVVDGLAVLHLHADAADRVAAGLFEKGRLHRRRKLIEGQAVRPVRIRLSERRRGCGNGRSQRKGHDHRQA